MSRFELGERDPRLSVVDRYAAGLGYVIQYHLFPARHAGSEPPVVTHGE